MGDFYMTFKAFHLIFMVAWFAGLFYLPRIFVYHAENSTKPDATAVFKVMARKLYKIIIVPGKVITILLGSGMIVLNPDLMKQPWMHLKLTLVLLLAGYSGFLGYARRRFERDQIMFTSKTWRLLNEVPTLFLFLIVFIAVFRYKLMG